jgi:hypothetical protein
MDLMPAAIPSIPVIESGGGAAINFDGSLLALVDSDQHLVRMYSVDGVGACTAGTVFSLAIPGGADRQLSKLLCACFVHRNGVDTLLIGDCGCDRIVEVSVSGAFLRAIALKMCSYPCGIAYCETSDVIAVSLHWAHAVVLLQYESGAVKPKGTIGSPTGAHGSGNGQLDCPTGVKFTADGCYILVADYRNSRVSKFSAASGAFIAHVATKAANGIGCPIDVLPLENGSVIVAQTANTVVVCVGTDGTTQQSIIIPQTANSLSYSKTWNAVFVKTFEGNVYFLRDAWVHSSRCAWLSAVTVR